MNLKEFYIQEPSRARSPECDYGVWWTDGAPYPRYRVSYIRATGEVYAVSLDGNDQVQILGVLAADDVPPRAIYYHSLEKILTGWSDGGNKDLAWVRERLTTAAAAGWWSPSRASEIAEKLVSGLEKAAKRSGAPASDDSGLTVHWMPATAPAAWPGFVYDTWRGGMTREEAVGWECADIELRKERVMRVRTDAGETRGRTEVDSFDTSAWSGND